MVSVIHKAGVDKAFCLKEDDIGKEREDFEQAITLNIITQEQLMESIFYKTQELENSVRKK